MIVADTSVLFEILTQGPLHRKCSEALGHEAFLIPSLAIFEIYKKIKMKVSEDEALSAVAALRAHQVESLTREIALCAAHLAIEHQLPMADSIVLAHASLHHGTLVTLDHDFAGLDRVLIVRY